MPAEQRRRLELVMGGAAHRPVEIDYRTLHIEMAYRGLGKRMPPGDQYAIEGFDRTLVKVAVRDLSVATGGGAVARASSFQLMLTAG